MVSSRNRCAIKSCRRSNKENNDNIAYFTVPRLSMNAYQSCIPTTVLSKASVLCSRHFDEDDIVKGKTIQDVFYPNVRWFLKKGAMPKHFLTADDLPVEEKNSKGIEKQNINIPNLKNKVDKKNSKLVDTTRSCTTPKCKSLETNTSMGALSNVNLQQSNHSMSVKTVKIPASSRSYSVPVIVPKFISELRLSAVQSQIETSVAEGEHTKPTHPNLEPEVSIISEEDVVECYVLMEHDYHLPSTFSEHDYHLPLTQHTSSSQTSYTAVTRCNNEATKEATVESQTIIQETINPTIESSVPLSSEEPVHSQAVVTCENKQTTGAQPVISPRLLVHPPAVRFVALTGLGSLIDEELYIALSKNVKLPSKSWGWTYSSELNLLSCLNMSRSTNGCVFNKTALVTSKSTVALLFNGVKISPSGLCTSFSSYDDLSEIIRVLDQLSYCTGICDESLKDVTETNKMSGRKDVLGVWRSENCSFIGGNGRTGLCPKCAVFRKYLNKKSKLELSKPHKNKVLKRKMEMRAYKYKIESLQRINEKALQDLSILRRELKELTAKHAGK